MSALEDLAEALLRIERGHVDITNPDEGPWLACSCGWVMDPAPQGAYREVRMRYHRAEALAEFVRAREAEALTQAAEYAPNDPAGANQWAWLRALADIWKYTGYDPEAIRLRLIRGHVEEGGQIAVHADGRVELLDRAQGGPQ